MKLKPTNLNIRTSQAEKDMLEQVAQANETTPSEMMRQLIRQAYAKLQENPMSNQTNHITAKWLKDAIENPSPDESYKILPTGNVDRAYRDFNGTWYNVEYTPSGEKVRDTTPWSNVPF